MPNAMRNNNRKQAPTKNKNKQKQVVKFVKQKNVPITKSTSTKMKAPQYKTLDKGNIIIKNQELITEIKTAAKNENNVNGFNILRLHVNPGLQQVFPWLNNLAKNYVSYKITHVKLVYAPRNNTTQPGSTMIYFEYDPSASSPQNRKDFLNRKLAQEHQVFEMNVFAGDPRDLGKEKTHYVRTGALQENLDIKLYDTCVAFFAYEGTNHSTIIGEVS